MAAAAALLPAAAGAQEFPQHPVRMVLPYPAGGPTDLLARVVAVKMGESLGQGVVVDNKPGASGMIGAETVARAPADGYTILANASLHVINPSIQPKMRYDAFKDFVPITQLADVPLVLVVNNASPVKTVQDLIAYARRVGGALNFGSAGNASAQHLAGESFKLAAKVPMQHVPYKGSAPALTDLMGGQIQLMFDSMPSAMPFIKSGKLRAVAVTTTRRASALPDIPTVAESGLPGFDISTWYGLWAPRGTPAAVVEKLATHAAAALKRADVRQQYADMGAEPVGSSPADFARYNAAEGRKWAEIVRRSGAKADQ
nr:tripartite tricarboxylate transporter substrate binding protein [Cupriavidus necator]